jgi:hypothetical protein
LKKIYERGVVRYTRVYETMKMQYKPSKTKLLKMQKWQTRIPGTSMRYPYTTR